LIPLSQTKIGEEPKKKTELRSHTTASVSGKGEHERTIGPPSKMRATLVPYIEADKTRELTQVLYAETPHNFPTVTRMESQKRAKVEVEIEKLADDGIACTVEGNDVVCKGPVFQEEKIVLPINTFSAEEVRKRFAEKEVPKP
jgi:hypothetical protein